MLGGIGRSGGGNLDGVRIFALVAAIPCSTLPRTGIVGDLNVISLILHDDIFVDFSPGVIIFNSGIPQVFLVCETAASSDTCIAGFENCPDPFGILAIVTAAGGLVASLVPAFCVGELIVHPAYMGVY